MISKECGRIVKLAVELDGG